MAGEPQRLANRRRPGLLARYKDDFTGELGKQRAGLFSSEQPPSELSPTERRLHRDPEMDRSIGGIPSKVGRTWRNDYRLARNSRAFDAPDSEGSCSLEDLELLLHLGMDVLDGAVTGPGPNASHD